MLEGGKDILRITEENKKRIIELLDNLDEYDKVSVYNGYCEKNDYWDDRYYDMYELDDILYGKKPTEIIDICCEGFNTRDSYFKWGVFGIESFDYFEIEECELNAIVEYIINGEDFDCREIKNLIEEIEEGEEE